MVGEIEPLNDLQDQTKEQSIIERIFNEYPTRTIDSSKKLYRIRKDPSKPNNEKEYDSPPKEIIGASL